MFKKHKEWWFWLLGVDAFAILINTQQINIPKLIGGMAAHLLGALVLAIIPWGCYKLFGKNTTSEQFMWAYSVGLSIMLASFLIMKFHE